MHPASRSAGSQAKRRASCSARNQPHTSRTKCFRWSARAERDQLRLAEKRITGKVYKHYTGYPGGLRETGMQEMIDEKGVAEVFRKTVDGMIPRNSLSKERMKRLR